MSEDEKQKDTENSAQKAEHQGNPAELPVPEILPVLPLHGFVFFPGMGFPMSILHPASQKLIDEAILKDRLIAIVSHKEPAEEKEEQIEPKHLYRVGVLGYIHKLIKGRDSGYQVLISAIKKLKIVEFVQQDPYMTARVAVIPMEVIEDKEVEALLLNLRTQFKKLAELTSLPVELVTTVETLSDPFYIS
jgi:ATP-dependent Lon protease